VPQFSTITTIDFAPLLNELRIDGAIHHLILHISNFYSLSIYFAMTDDLCMYGVWLNKIIKFDNYVYDSYKNIAFKYIYIADDTF